MAQAEMIGYKFLMKSTHQNARRFDNQFWGRFQVLCGKFEKSLIRSIYFPQLLEMTPELDVERRTL